MPKPSRMDKRAGNPMPRKMPRENSVDGGAPKEMPPEKPMGDNSYDLEKGMPGPSPKHQGMRSKDRR